MTFIPMRSEDMQPLADLLAQMTGLPEDRVAGFVVMVAAFEEDGTPGGRLITSTDSLRTVKTMLTAGLMQVQDDLDRMAGLS